MNDRDGALALLEWYATAGVDEAIDETPHDRFSEAEEPRRPVRVAAATPPEKPPSPLRQAGAGRQPEQTSLQAAKSDRIPASAGMTKDGDARTLASAATTLDELERAVAAFEGCPLKATARTTCFADGNPQGRIMLIGEAPGRDEDIEGKPFVGRAGKLLDRMLGSIGLDRSRVYITNVVYWRPPGNRTPTPAEMQACLPFTLRQIELADPAVLVLLGGAAAKHLLQTTEGITRIRGKWRTFPVGGREIRTIATLHPAFLLRSPEQKRLAWADLLMIREALDELGLAPASEGRDSQQPGAI